MKQLGNRLILAPTDLGHFLNCRHLVSLELRAARGEALSPVRNDALLKDLRARGHSHERAYLERLLAEGLNIAGADEGEIGGGFANLDLEATLAAMHAGVDVVYQATLADDAWSGRVDFLRKVDTPSGLGAWSYEVFDTKLARETRAATILQLCVYSCLLGELQGVRPACMHVVTPGNDFEPLSYRVDEYAAYFRLLAHGSQARVDSRHRTLFHQGPGTIVRLRADPGSARSGNEPPYRRERDRSRRYR